MLFCTPLKIVCFRNIQLHRRVGLNLDYTPAMSYSLIRFFLRYFRASHWHTSPLNTHSYTSFSLLSQTCYTSMKINISHRICPDLNALRLGLFIEVFYAFVAAANLLQSLTLVLKTTCIGA